MKKIIIPFDGTNFSNGAFDFANRLNQVQPILLAGLFLPQIDYANMWSYSGGGISGPIFIPLVEDADVAVINENIIRFRHLCEKNHIEYRVHEDYREFALPELKHESRFADLMLIGSEEFYRNLGTNGPNAFLKDAIHHAECPVLIVPEHFTFPENLVLAYNGSEDAVFAIKQFAYLFPELTKLPTLLVTADSRHPNQDFPDRINIEELVARHFSQLTLMKLEFDPRSYFGTWITDKRSSLLVCGAFGRSSLSETIRKSFVSDVISSHRVPVFIAHR
jgi:hypothetical protein